MYLILFLMILPFISAVPLVGGPLEELPFIAGDNFNLFITLYLPVTGKITAWRFYAQNTGTVIVGVWRPQGADKYTLVGKNRLNAEQLGKQVRRTIVIYCTTEPSCSHVKCVH